MSKMKKCIPIVVFLLFIAVGISKAEPTPTVSYLMNTPVSMLDFGMFKLNTLLNDESAKLMISKTKPTIGVDYDWDSNRIKIIILYYSKKELNEVHDMKKEITLLIEQIKGAYFQYEHKAGKPTRARKFGVSMIDRCFTPPGFVSAVQPKNLVEELDKIIEINIIVTVLGGSKTIGKSLLISNKIYWENKESKP